MARSHVVLAASLCAALLAAPTVQAQISGKLSPDLRTALQDKNAEPVLATVVFDQAADPTPLMAELDNAVVSRAVGPIRWIVCRTSPASLARVAEMPAVHSVTSAQANRPALAPPDEERDAAVAARVLSLPKGTPEAGPRTQKVADIHKASAAWAKGYTGQGVVVAIVDTGVDFAHPDLQGTQARVPSGPYEGWPFSYDTLSGYYFALGTQYTVSPESFWSLAGYTGYARTVEVENARCVGGECTADLSARNANGETVTIEVTWPDTSKSGNYRYGVHPSSSLQSIQSAYGLGYMASNDLPSFFILADESQAGQYDTVYVDMDGDGSVITEKPMRKGDELAGADIVNAASNLGSDGVWDISAGMLTWVSDGANPPPGVGMLYPAFATVPEAGELVSFVSDSETHGTGVASDVAAQGVITDPKLRGITNPLFAGGADSGGVGGPVMTGMAPDARLVAFEHGLHLVFDAWTLAALGFDGQPQTGDEAHIVNNSFGNSATIEDGWNFQSRFAHAINAGIAPGTTFLASTGNGGHGYGTVASPSGGTIIGVGASTNYGSMMNYGFVTPEQITWGAVQPWSNRGPGMGGDSGPSITGVGAWGTGAYPLNSVGNGEAAYRAFGGTSMASPIACGVLALAHQAFEAQHGRFPSWEEAKALLQNGATDLGYDPMTMGAGDVNADLSTDIASGLAPGISPSEWRAGNFEGHEYPSFPNVIFAGEPVDRTFLINNPSGTKANFAISAERLERIHQVDFTVDLPSGNVSDFIVPTFLRELTDDIAAHDPDLLRVQAAFPFSTFDPNDDFGWDNRWRLWIYDWTDRDSDGNLWEDTNGNGLVEVSEIDVDGQGIQEHSPISVGYVTGTYLEASAGREVLGRARDGVFMGLQRRTGTSAVSIKVRITYFKRTAWDWIDLSETSISVPAGQTGSITATMTAPVDTRPGLYQGVLKVNDQTVPVVAQVAANSVDFNFGASSMDEPAGELPYDNGHVFGGFDWSWRYESGDWRLFPFIVPQDTQPGTQVIIETSWPAEPTDLDSWLFGPGEDEFSSSAPQFFGPYGQTRIAGSANTNLAGGIFAFETVTGGPNEVVGAAVVPGYHFLSLHNVLSRGDRIAEPVVGTAYSVRFNPFPATGKGMTGSWTQSIVSSRDIPEGLSVQAFGLSQPLFLRDQTIQQDNPNDVCTASWSRTLDIENAAVLIARTTSSASMDIDLFIFRDDGDGAFDCDDTQVAASTTSSSNESVELIRPVDGTYHVVVHGWSVPSPPQLFDIDIEGYHGAGLNLVGVPSGPVTADTPFVFTVNWNKPEPGDHVGVILVGPTSNPEILRIPVTIGDAPAPGTEAWVFY